MPYNMTSSTKAMSSEQTQAALRELLEGPAMSPPAGVISNFHDPPNLGALVTMTVTLCMGSGTLALVLRLYTKAFILRVLKWEDYVIVLAWLLNIGEAILSLHTTRSGAGTHMWDIQLQTFFRTLYWFNVSSIFYSFVIFFVRLSILLQYLRIFAPTRKGNMFVFVGVHICIWSNFIFYFFMTVFEITICTPRTKIWNPLITGHCFSFVAPLQASAVFNVLSDVLILLLPMPCVWRLHLPLKKKVLMTMIFAAGLFACISSILRTYYTWKLAGSPDTSYNIVRMGLWTSAEIATGFIISCLPVVPKFFQTMWPKVSHTFRVMSRNRKGLGIPSVPEHPAEELHRSSKIKLPSFKNTFASVFSHTEEGDDQTQPEREYAILSEEMAVPRRDAAREPSQMPAAKLGIIRDDLEKGVPRIKFAETSTHA